MANDIYKVNSKDVVGGPGRLVVRDFNCEGADVEWPEKIGDVMEPYGDYKLKDGWRDLGATNDGITTSRGFDTEDVEVDQSLQPIDDFIESWEHTMETNLAENTIENRQMAMIGSPIEEVSPETGSEIALKNSPKAGATLVKVEDASEIKSGQFVMIGDETIKVSKVDDDKITLASAICKDYEQETDKVTPIKELGYKKIGYGTVEDRPFVTVALISQKKDGTLYMAVFRKCKVAGDDVEQSFEKGETRYLPLNLAAFPVDNVSTEENVYYEIEQVL